ncbi:MAG: hypothetical protein ACRC76_14490 [Proteocatella sp.]
MTIDLKGNKKAKVIFRVVGILLSVGLFSYVYINFIDVSVPTVDQPQKQTQQVADKTKKPDIKPVENQATAQVVAMGNNGRISQNPFVEISEIRSGKPAAAMGAVPNNLPAGNDGLPQIPTNYPRPTVGAIPLPAIPGMSAPPLPAAAPQQQAANAPAGIKGVFTGTNGNSMAIMNDGQIVSTGDTYQDGRIAYIGGDGIQFDDGHTIAYK